jgi:hypothetical protein
MAKDYQTEFFERLIAFLNKEDIINGVYTGHRIEDKTLAVEIFSLRSADRSYPYVWLRLGWYEVTTLLEQWGLLDDPEPPRSMIR